MDETTVSKRHSGVLLVAIMALTALAAVTAGQIGDRLEAPGPRLAANADDESPDAQQAVSAPVRLLYAGDPGAGFRTAATR